MKQCSKLLALAAAVCLFEITPSLAATESTEAPEATSTAPTVASESVESSQARLESAIQKINLQTDALQKEITQLKAELHEAKESKALKEEKQQKETKQLKAQLQQIKREKQSLPKPAAGQAANAQMASNTEATKPASSLLNIPQLRTAPIVTGSLPAGSADLDPSAFLSFQNGMSQGMFLLEQQQALEKQLNGVAPPYADRPQVMLGGKLEARGTWQSPYANAPTNSSIDLVTAELEAFAQVSQWASGFLAIDYNNGLLDPILNGSGNPANNSSFYLNRGFFTIGNLNKSPFYFSAGQMYAPFGLYATNMLSNPVTKVLGRTNTRAAQIGFDKDGFNTSVYAFNGASNTSNVTLNNWGASAGYKFNVGEYAANFGTGFINNIAGAQGAQLTGTGMGTFAGFSQNPSTESIGHYVPGLDVNMMLARGPLYFIAEGIAATRSYDPADMTFNAVGAKPKAAHLEAGYNFKLYGKKSIFNVAYEETWDALAMGLPKNSYVATFSTSIWKNTVEILEFRHDVNYAATDSSSGACSFTNDAGQVFTVCPGSTAGGGKQNTLLAQFGVYF